jgi:ketosteroid isomerase-like protein
MGGIPDHRDDGTRRDTMLKCVALLKRREGMSREAFIDYYETRHAPLITELAPQILVYRRNFPEPDGRFEFGGAAVDFDCLTELFFADRAAYDAFAARCAEPDVARRIAEDEENVFDRAATRMMVVEERGGAIPGRGGAAADPLRLLDAERAIGRGLARFARVLDGKDWAALGEVFAPDLSFDYGQGERAGMAALEEQMRRYLDVCGGTQHLLGSLLVDVDGDRAVSRAYVQARHQRRDDAAGAIFDSNGEYVDRWERRAEGWRIVRRDALWATHSGDPAVLQAGTGELG